MRKPYKYLQTSDWHFGATRRLTPKSNAYLERHCSVLRSIIKLALKEKVDFALVAGDLFENASTTNEELVAAHTIFREFGEVCPVVATAGNHDELSVGDFQTKWLEALDSPNVTFVSKPKVVTIGTKGGVISVAAIPWTGIKVQEEFDALVSAVASAPQVEIGMLHECFIGITLDSGMSSKSGVKIPNLPNIRYWAVGDIHKYQRVQLPHAWYSGAPLQYTFGDQLPKGVIIVSVDEQGIHTPTFHQINCPIELHNISSLEQIPKDSPHWYKLRTEASKMPKHVPENVKVLEPVPSALTLPTPVVGMESEAQEIEPGLQSVDFTEGIPELLLSNGFSVDEIALAQKEVLEVIHSH